MKSNVLWEPTNEDIQSSKMWQFCQSINEKYQLSINDYQALYDWSIQNPDLFWKDVAEATNIKFYSEPSSIMGPEQMPNTQWFNGATLNYAEHCLQNRTDKIVITELDESGLLSTLTGNQLADEVSKVGAVLSNKQYKKGDVVAGILPNNKTAIIAMLAATSIGATWSSCSPDFGESGIIDRLEQVNPTCIICISDYIYKGKKITLSDRLDSIRSSLNQTRVWVLASDQPKDGWTSSREISLFKPATINFVPCSFSDPLFILFSSGTTGKPKCIVHSVGGTLIQHLKEHQLHCNLTQNDTLFYYTTCGWMMWNWMVSALASHASLVIFDGAAITSNDGSIWDLIKPHKITVFGTSASFIGASEKKRFDLNSVLSDKTVRLILSTGSPLLEHHFDYLYNSFPYSIQVGSISGGTDIVSCFALCNPLTPVRRGKIQGRGLGMDIVSWNEKKEGAYK